MIMYQNHSCSVSLKTAGSVFSIVFGIGLSDAYGWGDFMVASKNGTKGRQDGDGDAYVRADVASLRERVARIEEAGRYQHVNA